MKKLTSILAFITLITVSASTPSFAFAQSSGVQKALENAKETLDNLVTAKDDKQPEELSLRIKTLEQAFDLSIVEVKDARTKLDGLNDLEKNEAVWRDEKLQELEAATNYFETQKGDIEDNRADITAAEVKKIAEDFKTWRDENYLPTLNEVHDYFLIDQQTKTIEKAKTRWQKIDEDVKKLEKSKVKNIAAARKLLKNANALIAESQSINDDARTMFFDTFINVSTSTATSSDEATIKIETKTEAKTIVDATSTAAGEIPQPESIRDLVKDSSSKIRDAYKIFIDMSSLVRRLLK